MIYLLCMLCHQLQCTSLEPKITYFLMVSLLRRKIAYVMLTSIPWECLNSLVGGKDEFGKH